MSGTFKKVLSVLLCAALLFGSTAVGGLSATAAGENYDVGDTIVFGSYPQSRVTDAATLAALNALSLDWQSYGYYSVADDSGNGQMTASDFMRYADAEYNGAKYRAVVFDSYRPYDTSVTVSESDSYQYYNGYRVSTVYWFRYDPLEWRVLDPATGLVLCNTVIDSQPYNNYLIAEGTGSHGERAHWGDPAKTHYACDYVNSSLRQWLNNDFYNTAFSEAERTRIAPTTLDNTGFRTLIGETGYEDYDSAATTDKIFLLGFNDVRNPSYGFEEDWLAEDPSRILQGSDYAKCQGLCMEGDFELDCLWWLRSPGYICFRACFVNWYGDVCGGDNVNSTGYGVAPALCLLDLASQSGQSYTTGDTLVFGSYPQSEVTDAATLAALSALTLDWQSYGYYSGTGNLEDGQMTAKDFMRYADVDYNGEKYRAVVFDSYRPFSTGYTSEDNYQQENGFTAGTVYWFLYEPIHWRVLDPGTGLVIAQTILDAQAYQNYDLYIGDPNEHFGDAGATYYANNYANSSLRAWLNDDFYNTAFSAAEKSSIAPTTLDNRNYTDYGYGNFERYNSPSTTDNVFLLSYAEMVNSDFGYDTDRYADDPYRTLVGTAYAKSQGLLVSSAGGYLSDYQGNSFWLLRSSGDYSDRNCYVDINGGVYSNFRTRDTFAGVVPAMRLNNLGPHTHWYTAAVTQEPTCTAEGVMTYTCFCGESYTEAIEKLPHTAHDVVTVPSSCTEDGLQHEECAVCGARLSEDVVLPAYGHSCSEWIMVTDPTPTSCGSMCCYCIECGILLEEMTVPMLSGTHVTGVTLSYSEAYLNLGETLTLTADITPETATNKTLIWSSSRPNVATVEDGVVTPVAPGITVIIAQSEDGGDKDFCLVQVNAVTARNGVVLDNGMVYGLSVNLSSLEDYLELADETMSIRTEADAIGTGTKILIMQGDLVVNEFEAVIFGDVDGDSWYDGTDAYFVRLVADGLVSADALTDAQRTAADCNHDGVIDADDVAVLEQAGLLLVGIDQTAPSEELQTNSVYLTYCGLVDQGGETVDEQPVEPQPTEAEPQPAAQGLFSRIMAVFTVILNWLLGLFKLA